MSYGPAELDDAESAPADGEDFDLLLPIAVAGGEEAPTHVVTMRGNEARFVAALDDLLLGDDVVSRALRVPVETISLGRLADILNAVGAATVQSIDRR
jgi:hypothetical protein